MYLGVGIGNGTLTGLALPAKMIKKNNVIAPASGINSVAEGLGMGITSSIVGSINVSSLFAGATDPSTINTAVLSLAQGLGGGAAQGLQLKASSNGTFNTSGLSGIAGNLGQGLTASFLGGVNVTKVVSMVGGNMTLTGANLLAAANGLGSGLAEGAVVGLGFQQDSGVPEANGTAGVGPIIQTFAKGLSESFLANGTVTKAISSVRASTVGNLTGGGLGGLSLSSLPIGKVAAGFAVGLVDGAQSSIENAGGIGGILNISPSDTVGMMAMPTISNFDDGVGGAATGFGTGLGSELTKGLLQAFGKPPLNSTTDAISASSTSSDSSPSPSRTTVAAKRSPPDNVIGKRSVAVAGYKRQSQTPMQTSKLDLMMLNTTLDPIIQGGIDTLGCQGVGGVVAIGLSLLESGKISLGSFGNLTSSFASLTNQTYTIKEGGNTYTANLSTKDITLNGQPVVKAVVLIVLHGKVPPCN
jgi:hypothetical protein